MNTKYSLIFCFNACENFFQIKNNNKNNNKRHFTLHIFTNSRKQSQDNNYVPRLDFKELQKENDRLHRELSHIKKENQR